MMQQKPAPDPLELMLRDKLGIATGDEQEQDADEQDATGYIDIGQGVRGSAPHESEDQQLTRKLREVLGL